VKTTFPKRYLVRCAALLAVAAIAACESSDKLPPKGSTITVAANPATIPLATSADCLNLLGVQTCGKAGVVATVASELGVPLPDQDVRFSSTAGFLYTGTTSNPVNAANIPIRSDKFGNSTVQLITSTTATVTAKSGQATAGTLTVNTVQGNLSTVLLNNDTSSTGCSGSTTNVTSCTGQTICFKATALDNSANGVPSVVLFFSLQNNTSTDGKTFKGTFNFSQVTTDSNGNAFSQLTPDSTCPTQCSASQNGGKSCTAQVIASSQGGAIVSGPVTLTFSIP
jgi:hypothetical protein